MDDLKGLTEIHASGLDGLNALAKVGEVEQPDVAKHQLPVANETVPVKRQQRTVVVAQDVEYERPEQSEQVVSARAAPDGPGRPGL